MIEGHAVSGLCSEQSEEQKRLNLEMTQIQLKIMKAHLRRDVAEAKIAEYRAIQAKRDLDKTA